MNRDPLHQAFQEGRISAHQSETRGFFVPPGTIASTADGWSLAVDHIEQLQAALQQASAASDPKLNQVVGLRFDLKHGYEVRLIEVDVLPVATQPKTPSPEIDTRAVPLAPATTIAGPAGSEPLGTAAQPGVDGNVCTPQRAHPLKMATPPEAKTTVVAQADTQALDLHPMAPDEHARARTVRAVQRKLKAAA